jgi:lambda family phage portal protein
MKLPSLRRLLTGAAAQIPAPPPALYNAPAPVSASYVNNPNLQDLLAQRGVGSGTGAFFPGAGLGSGGGLPSNELRSARYLAEASARQMINNHPLLQFGVELVSDMMLGETGLHATPCLDHNRLGITLKQADALAEQFESIFDAWSASPSATTTGDTFHAAIECSLRRAFETGAMLGNFTFKQEPGARLGTRYQPIETVRIGRNSTLSPLPGTAIYDGVEVEIATGKIVALHILPTQPVAGYATGFESYQSTPVRVPLTMPGGRPNLCYSLFSKRGPGVVHGISPISAGVLSACAQDEYLSIAIRQAAARASVVFSVITDQPPEAVAQNLLGGDPAAMKPGAPPNFGDVIDFLATVKPSFTPNTISVMPPGSKLEAVGVEQKGDQFEAFNKAVLVNVARSFGLTYGQLTGDLSQDSFSSAKLSNAAPWSIAARRRDRMITPQYRAAYRCVIEEAVERGLVKLPRNRSLYDDMEGWLACDWSGPVAPSVDPKGDSAADVQNLLSGITSRTQIAKRRGTDHRRVLRELAAEEALAKSLGLNLSLVSPQVNNPKETDENEPADSAPVRPAPATKRAA